MCISSSKKNFKSMYKLHKNRYETKNVYYDVPMELSNRSVC